MNGNSPDFSSQIVQTVREPMLVLDADLRVVMSNPSFHRTFQVSAEETRGQLIYRLGNGQWDIPELRTLLDELLPSDGHFDDYEVAHNFPAIGPRTMLLNARRLYDANDRTKLILLAIEDVTARREAEREAERQRAWFETTLASIGDAVIATDAEAHVTFLNAVAEAMTGWTAEEARGKPLLEVFNIVNETTRNLVESPVSKAIRMGAIVGLANHTILISRDGREWPIDDSAAPIRDNADEIAGVVMVFHDITDRRQGEQLIESSEIRYRRLFEAAHDGILILDMDTRRITDANPFMLDLLDYPREHFIGKELWEIGVFSDKDESQRAMRELDGNGSIRYENKPLQDRNGRRRPVEIVANVYQEDHHPVIQCNIRDIGERAIFERERAVLLSNEQAMRLEAEAANRVKDIFLATLSHELRTPLNAVLGWAVLLRSMSDDATLDRATIKEAANVIERNSKMQAQLVDDVLDVSRIVSGNLRLEIRRAELSQIVADAVAAVRAAADAKEIEIRVKVDSDASPIACDPARIQQVIWNLLTNAIKFSSKRNVVDIAGERMNSMTRITVTDYGEGIDAGFLPHVFERFRQSDGSSTRRHGGLGLGLSIVRHLVELHGGTVDVRSGGSGMGASFIVNLPLRAIAEEIAAVDDAPESLESGLNSTAVRLDGLLVLVVDDEPDARNLIKIALEQAGALVAAADSVAAALKLMQETSPDIVVSDISMPDQDGFDLMRQIRSLGEGHTARDLPAVALTAYARAEDRRRVMLAGFQVHVAKPVDPHELTAVIASLTGRTGHI